jgi:uncharacterized protein involved in tellurium resistance
MQLKSKVVLKDKGQSAVLPASFNEMLVSLKWTKDVDLDLMAFYTTKDGQDGAVYTTNLGGSHGDLNAHPFMKLSGDAGVGAQGGDNQEDLTISKLDTMKKIFIAALNYTAQSKNTPEAFGDYDGGIQVKTDGQSDEDSFGLLLDSMEKGTVALIATIDNTGVAGPKLVKENRVMSLQDLVAAVPQAVCLTK